MGIVRELTADDSEAAAGLVASIWRDDPVFIGRADSISQNQFASVLVAVDDGKIVGVGTLGGPSRHPHRMVSVDVGKSSSRRGIGSALLAGLREKVHAAPLVSRLRPWDVSANRFYTALGFELVEKSHSVVLDPTTNEAGAWVTTALTEKDDGIRLLDRISDDLRRRRRFLPLSTLSARAHNRHYVHLN